MKVEIVKTCTYNGMHNPSVHSHPLKQAPHVCGVPLVSSPCVSHLYSPPLLIVVTDQRLSRSYDVGAYQLKIMRWLNWLNSQLRVYSSPRCIKRGNPIPFILIHQYMHTHLHFPTLFTSWSVRNLFVLRLRPCQQLRSCRAGQLPINTVPTKRLTST